jgi:hypothetical protein
MKVKLTIFLVVALCCLGCRTPHTSPEQRLQLVVGAVLAEHRFAPPTIMSDGHGNFFAVAARPHSSTSVDVARIDRHAEGRATVEIQSYQYGPSDWARLGPVFSRVQDEASTMEIAIRERMSR